MLEKDFVEYVVKSLVSHPEQVNITVDEGEATNVITINVETNDFGKIIGHRGNYINSIRSLLSVVAKNSDKKWVIDVPDRSERS